MGWECGLMGWEGGLMGWEGGLMGWEGGLMYSECGCPFWECSSDTEDGMGGNILTLVLNLALDPGMSAFIQAILSS